MKPVTKSARRRLSTQATVYHTAHTTASPADMPSPPADRPQEPAPDSALAALNLNTNYAPTPPPAALELDSAPAATSATKGIRMPKPGYFEPSQNSPPSGGHHSPPPLADPTEELVSLSEVPLESWDPSPNEAWESDPQH